MFNDPQMIQKLAANPQTSKYLADPAFMMKLQQMKNNPSGGAQALMGDPRMIQVMGVLLGLDASMMGGMGGEPSGIHSFLDIFLLLSRCYCDTVFLLTSL
jgi:stress-induced-phosphoprotein 1